MAGLDLGLRIKIIIRFTHTYDIFDTVFAFMCRRSVCMYVE